MKLCPHRRRSLVIALLAVVLCLAAARLAHRQADTRFIGKWTVHSGGGAASWPAPCIEFRADGTGTWWSSNIPLNRIYSPYSLRWSTDRDRIIWRHEYGSLSDAINGEYDRLRYRVWDRNANAPHEMVFDIVEATPNEIQVDLPASSSDPLRWTLRRAE
jgi:hypothetical protein